MATTTKPTVERKYAEQIQVDGGAFIRIIGANPERKIRIHGRSVRIGDIPYAMFWLQCGHQSKGVAIATGDWVFCEECEEKKMVARTKQ